MSSQMVPRSVLADAAAAKAQTTPLTSPVSLLWAHQLRRENAALLERINELSNSVNNVSVTQINRIAAQAKKAEEKSNKAAVEVEKLRKAAQVDRKKIETVESDTYSVLAKMDASAPDVQNLQDRMKDVEKRLDNTVLSQLEKVGHALEVKLNGQDYKVTQLHDRVRDLEDRLLQFGNERATVIQDSVQQMMPIAEGRPREHREQADDLPARVSSRPRALEHVEETLDEQMLTQHLQRPLRNNETPLGDIDLDEPSPSNQVGQPRDCESEALETMAMISQLAPSQLHLHNDPSCLKQGKFQSFSDYMVAGQVFVDATPKRKEGTMVEAFMDGIHSAEQKMRFETRLDEKGWLWENVKELARNIIAEEAETQLQAQPASPGLVHLEGGQSATNCGRNSPMLAAKNKIPTKARLLAPRQARPNAAANPLRRSQRIRDASRDRTADKGKGSAWSLHKVPQMVVTSEHARESGKKLKRVTLVTPNKTQHQNPRSIRGNSIEMVRLTPCAHCNLHSPCAECASTDLTCTRPTDAPPQQGKDTANGLRLEERGSRAGNHTEEGVQEAGSTAGSAQQPQKDPLLQPSSKKRSRECEMEVQNRPVDDLETPVRQKNPRGQPQSPKQKRRKRRRALSPIPMIPILPLSDEED